jgi:four helix bundle protein
MGVNQGMSPGERQDLRKRTKDLALRIIRLYAALPNTVESQVLGKQLLRSGTSVGAHYREACRAKSNPDFISKIEGGLQELDETLYWLELVGEAQLLEPARLKTPSG